jgi:ligand-binding sensor domain-containing protein
MGNFLQQIIGMSRNGDSFSWRILQIAIISLLLTIPATNGFAQASLTKFNLVEGVGEISLGKITGITQDPQGYMWFSDQDKNCITRFDGYNMVSYRYDPGNRNSLGGSYPETVFADPNGYIWIGFYGMGLDRFDPKTETFTHYRHRKDDSNSISSDTVSAIIMDAHGLLWVGTHNGLDCIDPKNGVIKHFRHDPSNTASLDYNVVRSLCIDQQGTLWIGTGIPWDLNPDGGLNRFDPLTQEFAHFLPNKKVRSIFEDSHGNFWIGALGNKLFKMDRSFGTFTPVTFSPPPASPVDHITFIREDGAGTIWFGTFESGLIRYDPYTNTSIHYGDGTGLLDNSGWQAFTSRDGVFWFSTQQSNLFRVDPLKKIFSFHHTGGIAQGFREETAERLWVASTAGLMLFNDKERVIDKIFPDTALQAVSIGSSISFQPDGKNQFWLVTGGRLAKFNLKNRNVKLHSTPTDPGFNGGIDFVLAYLVENDSVSWIGKSSGLFQMNKVTNQVIKWKKTAPVNGRTDLTTVAVLYLDSRKELWVGTMADGLFHRNPGSGTFDQILAQKDVTSIYEDSDGNLWVGTTYGLYNRKKSTGIFSLFNLPGSPISSTEINGIIEDDTKHIWVSSRSGIFKINRDRNRIIGYGNNQGINSTVLSRGIYKKMDGQILIGAKGGYYSFYPNQQAENNIPPQIVLRDLKVSNQLVLPLEHSGAIKLRQDQDIFSIGFAGIHFSSPGENTHMYMLEGYDPGWRKAGAERTAYYFNVPPGNYIFRVKVANNEDVWAEHSIPIEIVPAWWNTMYFKIGALLLGILLLYGAIRWRIRHQFKRQLERSETEKQLSELKHRSSQLEMQALRSQMNPHFIFNSLNSINRFILQNNKSQASVYLTKFSRLIRYILQNSEQALIPLENELHALELYLELEALRFDQHFDYTITLEEGIDVTAILVPPLIIQPYVENAIWHGLMHKEEKGHLEIELIKEGDWLCCIIRDDGIGRQRARELKSKSANTHKSMGMHITAGRIDLLKNPGPNQPAITIKDLVFPDGTAGGTEVIIKIPIRYD